jgi:hypothetical protein
MAVLNMSTLSIVTNPRWPWLTAKNRRDTVATPRGKPESSGSGSPMIDSGEPRTIFTLLVGVDRDSSVAVASI